MATKEQEHALRGALAFIAAGLGLLVALLFLSAGTLDWANAWAFLAITVFMLTCAIIGLWRVNPEVFVARASVQPSHKAWDHVYFVIIACGFLDVPLVAGLDYRWDWAQASEGLVWFGRVLFVLSLCAQWWAQAVNPHFETAARIQSDRAHKVIDTGPYAHIRHPGYVAASALAVATALSLGSLVALIPALIAIVALWLRTNAEDQMLQKELTGYADYALRVRFKWVPGVW